MTRLIVPQNRSDRSAIAPDIALARVVKTFKESGTRGLSPLPVLTNLFTAIVRLFKVAPRIRGQEPPGEPVVGALAGQ